MSHKILKKITNLFGFKLIDKNFIKNNRALSGNSAFNLNLILKNIFEKHNIENLIQIGANDGISFDEINFFIKKYKVKSILVEPIKENFKKLKENYKNLNFINFENVAISNNNKINYLYKVDANFISKYGSEIPAIPSFNIKHLINHGVKKSHIVKEKVDTSSIKNLIEKYQIKKLDLLFIDAEGYDGDIVLDFLKQTNLRPIIIFEYIHIENKIFKDLMNMIASKKFSYFNLNECIISFPSEKKIEISI
ncbi:FkbM family methyltransferase [Candidatus Pelagibacter sp.]|nr:FkbM family methyltransferase [Candidatus Pelagibacter sp.]